MIPQLVQRIASSGLGYSQDDARDSVLQADPLDIVLHMSQVWEAYDPGSAAGILGRPTARQALANTGQFAVFLPDPLDQAWDHLGYSYVLENSRAVQIFRRVVRSFRCGESLGLASRSTLRWLDTTEALLFGSANPFAGWLSTTPFVTDGESARRNAYWRLLGLDLAFGTEDNRPPDFVKAGEANTTFVGLFEELLFELWQAITNLRNIAGVNNADDDRIFRLAEALNYMLRARREGKRQANMLSREELAAATVLGWIEQTLSADTSVVVDMKAQGTSAANRLSNIGAKVGIPAHSKSSALFSMAAELSKILKVIESGVVNDPTYSWILYREQPIGGSTTRPYGAEARRVITEWAAATGRDLKARGKPIETSARRLVSVR